ncbi:hybrid sensor histidine kinase/response regulator [Duganella sp. BJB1802]|uniref:sensor histidine kinase n=1 Tax=Duganella sp. BJB1802 TaxID=2744575 RepID=UPI0015947058|nr:hybrid sensor histidine kinase/response regulator [Duganella sp. BJB1802]NVD73353.1 hybrid sensor histidine kinase/response regulator [Duganella sp. BJB1802]
MTRWSLRRYSPRAWLRGLPEARRALALIGAALLLLLAVTTFGVGYILRGHEIDDWRQGLGNLSLMLAETTAQSMASGFEVLDSTTEVAQTLLRGGGDEHAPLRTRQLFQTMREIGTGLRQVDVISLIDAEGELLNFSRSYPAPAVNVVERDYFIWHRDHASAAPFVSAPVRNKVTDRWVYYLSRRLNHADGSFAGVVLVGISVDYFVDYFRRVSLGQHASVSLYRDDYTLMARWPQAENLMGTKVSTGVTQAVIADGLDADVRVTRAPRVADGLRPVLRMGAVRRVHNYPLIINATITEDLLLAGWWRNLKLLAAVALAGTLGLLAAFWLVGRLLARRARDAEQAQALRRQADAANLAKSRFLAMMSHEIRTPMGGVAGMAELLLETGLDPVQRGYAQNVCRGIGELTHIINDVLDFSKIESGHMQLEQQPFDPAAQLEQVVALHRAAAERKGLRLELSAGAGPLWVRGDAARLRQVLGNLLSNAIKFSPSGVIALEYSAEVDGAQTGLWRLRYVVSDQGIGISEAAQARLFEPYTQADSTISGQYGGTGLGLAICKRLLELMGGHIGCANRPGAGALRLRPAGGCRLAPAAHRPRPPRRRPRRACRSAASWWWRTTR